MRSSSAVKASAGNRATPTEPRASTLVEPTRIGGSERRRDTTTNFFDAVLGQVAGHDHGELVTPDPCHQALRHGALETGRDLGENLVANRVPARVIDTLKLSRSRIIKITAAPSRLAFPMAAPSARLKWRRLATLVRSSILTARRNPSVAAFSLVMS